MRIKFIVLTILFLLMATTAIAGPGRLTFHNCEIDTWVGGVRWTDANKTDYVDVPEIELYGMGVLTALVEPGIYAITHYRPPVSFETESGRVMILAPAKILDYRDNVVVEEGKETILEFGNCK